MLGLFEKPYPNEEPGASVRHGGVPAGEPGGGPGGDDAPEERRRRAAAGQGPAKCWSPGPRANKLSVLNSGWTITWQGDKEELYPQEKHTILEAIQTKVGKENVTYVDAVTFDKEIDIARAVAAAGASMRSSPASASRRTARRPAISTT